jgi:hypothetical protein
MSTRQDAQKLLDERRGQEQFVDRGGRTAELALLVLAAQGLKDAQQGKQQAQRMLDEMP